MLGIVAGVLLIDHDVRATEFQQVPYHRIFIMLFLELNAPDQILETINFQVLTAYSNMLSILRPAKVLKIFFTEIHIYLKRYKGCVGMYILTNLRLIIVGQGYTELNIYGLRPYCIV